eukprot:scaffold6800_cov89-Skeletonema_dohrnii-CCMP3373.AAC.3
MMIGRHCRDEAQRTAGDVRSACKIKARLKWQETEVPSSCYVLWSTYVPFLLYFFAHFHSVFDGDYCEGAFNYEGRRERCWKGRGKEEVISSGRGCHGGQPKARHDLGVHEVKRGRIERVERAVKPSSLPPPSDMMVR